jgi:hypothetical protein
MMPIKRNCSLGVENPKIQNQVHIFIVMTKATILNLIVEATI